MRQSDLLTKLVFLQSDGGFGGHFKTQERATGSIYSVIGLGLLRERLQIALQIPGLSDDAEKMAKAYALQMAGDACGLDYSQNNTLRHVANTLDMISSRLAEYLRAVYAASLADPHIVSVKLPIRNQLAYVSQAIQELDTIFSQCLSILDEPTTVEVTGWERGSLWIDIALGSSVAVSCIGGLAWSAVCVLKKYREQEMLQQLIAANGIKNEMLGDIRAALKKTLDDMLTAEAMRLDKLHSKKKGDPETIQRLTHCIRSLFDMVQQGAEVHPALLAPQDVQDVFPKMDQTLGLPSSTKLLREHGDQEDQEDENKTVQ